MSVYFDVMPYGTIGYYDEEHKDIGIWIEKEQDYDLFCDDDLPKSISMSTRVMDIEQWIFQKYLKLNNIQPTSLTEAPPTHDTLEQALDEAIPFNQDTVKFWLTHDDRFSAELNSAFLQSWVGHTFVVMEINTVTEQTVYRLQYINNDGDIVYIGIAPTEKEAWLLALDYYNDSNLLNDFILHERPEIHICGYGAGFDEPLIQVTMTREGKSEVCVSSCLSRAIVGAWLLLVTAK